MTAILIAVVGALVYGTADFLGGLATLRRRAVVVVAGTQAVGAVMMVPVLALTGGQLGPAAIGWGVCAGISGAVGVTFYYKALSIGPMGLVAPISAVIGALVPVAAGLRNGESLSALSAFGVALAVVAILLASLGSGSATSGGGAGSLGLLLAVIAGVGFGGLFVAADAAPDDSGFWPLAAARVASVVLMTVVAVATYRGATAVATAREPLAAVPLQAVSSSTFTQAAPSQAAPRWGGNVGFVPLVIVTGVLDQGANIAFLVATRAADLAIVGVLVSLYPVAVVALAATVLGERLTARFAAAAAAAMAAAALVAVGS